MQILYNFANVKNKKLVIIFIKINKKAFIVKIFDNELSVKRLILAKI